jgi:hypothetical protein
MQYGASDGDAWDVSRNWMVYLGAAALWRRKGPPGLSATFTARTSYAALTIMAAFWTLSCSSVPQRQLPLTVAGPSCSCPTGSVPWRSSEPTNLA